MVLRGEHGEYFTMFIPDNPDAEVVTEDGMLWIRTDQGKTVPLPIPHTWDGLVAEMFEWTANEYGDYDRG